MPGLSLHVVDVARGHTAAGMWVEIFRLHPDRQLIADGRLAENGMLDHPTVAATLTPGIYEAVFHAGDYFAGATLEQTDPPFLDLVPFRFTIAEPEKHIHLPLKITPWGYSLYRGA